MPPVKLQFFGQHSRLAKRAAFTAFLTPLRKIRWYVYGKRPFAGPEAVLAYLSRYTHRVAIANSRLIAFDKNTVSFKYKDYRFEGPDRYKVMTLATDEFIRRFLIHVLPKGLHASATTACSPRPSAPTTSHAPANCSVAKSPKAILPIIMMATRRPPSRALVHAAADAWSSSRSSSAAQRPGIGRQLQSSQSGSIPHERNRPSTAQQKCRSTPPVPDRPP